MRDDFIMFSKKPPVKTCLAEYCSDCRIHEKTNCSFSPAQLFKFYIISLPPFIIAGVCLYNYNTWVLPVWLLIIFLFFFVIEIRVLCSHCPHYEKSLFFLRCWANYGAPKLFKYRPGPLNLLEKFILISGFILVWGYPAVFLLIQMNGIVMFFYVLLVMLFFIILKKGNCSRCINFSCPLNGVEAETKAEFFRINPEIGKHWGVFPGSQSKKI